MYYFRDEIYLRRIQRKNDLKPKVTFVLKTVKLKLAYPPPPSYELCEVFSFQSSYFRELTILSRHSIFFNFIKFFFSIKSSFPTRISKWTFNVIFPCFSRHQLHENCMNDDNPGFSLFKLYNYVVWWHHGTPP